MLTIPVIHEFIEELTLASKESISDLTDAERVYQRLKRARIKAEGDLFRAC